MVRNPLSLLPVLYRGQNHSFCVQQHVESAHLPMATIVALHHLRMKQMALADDM